MSEDLDMTQPTQSESAEAPEDEQLGLSESASRQLGLTEENEVAGFEDSAEPQELPEAYKPYSQFPWHQLPEQTREQFFTQLKKFHGDMSRAQGELGTLRRQADEFRQKALYFDELTTQPWFLDAYRSQQTGGVQQATQTPADLSKLSEFGLDGEAAKTLQTFIDQKLGSTIGPLSQQLQNIQKQLINDQVERELAQLRTVAQREGWPSPDEKLSRISEIIQQGRARTPTDAYHLAVGDEIRDLTAQKARSSLQEELKTKAQRTLSPYQGTPGTPTEELFTGPDAVQRALRASMQEIAARRATRR